MGAVDLGTELQAGQFGDEGLSDRVAEIARRLEYLSATWAGLAPMWSARSPLNRANGKLFMRSWVAKP